MAAGARRRAAMNQPATQHYDATQDIAQAVGDIKSSKEAFNELEERIPVVLANPQPDVLTSLVAEIEAGIENLQLTVDMEHCLQTHLSRKSWTLHLPRAAKDYLKDLTAQLATLPRGVGPATRPEDCYKAWPTPSR